jgi:hypothetical protein
MAKTRKIFSKLNKRSHKRHKTKGKKYIHKKTVRRGKKIGGLIGAAENVEEEVKGIEKLLIIGGSSNYEKAIGLLINLTKSGKRSCRKSRYILKKDEICELDKTNAYDKANQLFRFIEGKIEEETINDWIKKFDSRMNMVRLTELLDKKKHRENKLKEKSHDVETIVTVLKNHGKKIAYHPLSKKEQDDGMKPVPKYEENLMNATIIMNSEWYGLFLNKVLMYEFLTKDKNRYLEISNKNSELGLERIILDAQEQTDNDPDPLSSKYHEFTHPLRTWILESGKGGQRTVESYKKRNRTMFKEVLEYFKEENPQFKESVNKVIEGLKMNQEKEILSENNLNNEIKELLEWEKTPEKEIYDEKFGKTYNNHDWRKKLNKLKRDEKNENWINSVKKGEI